MTADYAISLKKAWSLMYCPGFCLDYHSSATGYCKGHAALLEMVEAYVDGTCVCVDLAGGSIQRDDGPANEERRRLRAAVGVDE